MEEQILKELKDINKNLERIDGSLSEIYHSVSYSEGVESSVEELTEQVKKILKKLN